MTVNHWVVGSNPTLGAMKNIKADSNDFCVDCSVDTVLIGEYYMVHDHVWFESGMTKTSGMLCISCLEKRIKRQLNSDDFKNLPINNISIVRSSKLLLRLLNKKDTYGQ